MSPTKPMWDRLLSSAPARMRLRAKSSGERGLFWEASSVVMGMFVSSEGYDADSDGELEGIVPRPQKTHD